MPKTDRTAQFHGKVVGVIGGDRRQHEIIRNVLDGGAVVRTFGVPAWDAPEGVSRVDTVAAAQAEADVVVLPVPSFLRDRIVFAPEAPREIEVTIDFLNQLKPGAVLAVSKALDEFEELLSERRIAVCVMGHDDIMQVHHAIPTAEGALRITIQETDFTVFGANCVVIGFGRVAQSMARSLKGLGARVTVIARREEARVRAVAESFASADFSELPEVVAGADLIYNTVPFTVLDHELLRKVKPGTLVMDLASPPGGVDQEAAATLGVHSIWARAQAGSAPRYAGWAQFQVIDRFLKDRSGDGSNVPEGVVNDAAD